ncbi:hypothetical protein C0Q70_09370 [Pomacea canaliculata]|uniref:Uncharacterized protein n=1 Tax=Pomacea canaliculata TaxID=400727 RepID=A0A2T7P9L7_POMCA|nr:hypothetical protein C0Q70_09370 [Pomacea canaliculata]
MRVNTSDPTQNLRVGAAADVISLLDAQPFPPKLSAGFRMLNGGGSFAGLYSLTCRSSRAPPTLTLTCRRLPHKSLFAFC